MSRSPIENGRISGIEKHAKPALPDSQVIDLKGKWLLPGYIDAHVTSRRSMPRGRLCVGIDHCERCSAIIFLIWRSGTRIVGRTGSTGRCGCRLPDSTRYVRHVLRRFSCSIGYEGTGRPGTRMSRRVVRALFLDGVDHIKFLATERSGTPDTIPAAHLQRRRSRRPCG